MDRQIVPQTEVQSVVKVQEFDTTTPLDMKRAIENFGMIEQFFKMLATYLNSPDFVGHLTSLGEKIDERNLE